MLHFTVKTRCPACGKDSMDFHGTSGILACVACTRKYIKTLGGNHPAHDADKLKDIIVVVIIVTGHEIPARFTIDYIPGDGTCDGLAWTGTRKIWLGIHHGCDPGYILAVIDHEYQHLADPLLPHSEEVENDGDEWRLPGFFNMVDWWRGFVERHGIASMIDAVLPAFLPSNGRSGVIA